jgi:hypothetical protein
MTTLTESEGITFVSGHLTFPTIGLAVTTSQAYSSGDCVGGVISFADAFRSTNLMSGILQTMIIVDKGTTSCSGMDFYFLDTATTGTAPTNDSALALADADLLKVCGRVQFTSGDYRVWSDNSIAVKDNLGIPVRATTGTTLLAVAMMTSTGFVYTSTGDVTVKLSILAD